MSRWTMPGRVRRRERLGHLAATSSSARAQRRAALALRDVLPVEPLHRDVGLPLVELPEGHHAHDARVREPREHPPLATEARLFARVDAGDGDDLERHRRLVTSSCAR